MVHKICRFVVILSLVLITTSKAEVWDAIMSPGVTNIAATSTNTTPGQVFHLRENIRDLRIYVSGYGTAASTNGTLTVFFQTSPDMSTNVWCDASTSNIKLTFNTMGASTNYVCDWFATQGVRFFRQGRVENTFLGPVSNLNIRIATTPENVR